MLLCPILSYSMLKNKVTIKYIICPIHMRQLEKHSQDIMKLSEFGPKQSAVIVHEFRFGISINMPSHHTTHQM